MSLNDFNIIKELGKGVFGTVYLAKRKEDNKTYAIKQVSFSNLKQKDISNSLNEIRILASISHPNIIAYKESFYDSKTKTLNLVLEYADDGDLQSKITKHKNANTHFPESEIWSTFIQMICGLNELHLHNIMHRDLKSANVFLTQNGFCKLGDMNVSKVIKEGLLRTQTGTPYYASPEVWMDKPYNIKSDIWSIGCILYEMCSLSLPFKGKTFDNVYKNVIKGVYNPIPNHYSKELSQVIFGLLQINPNNRPDCEQILKHAIVKEKYDKYLSENIRKSLLPYVNIGNKKGKTILNNINNNKLSHIKEDSNTNGLLNTLYVTNEKEIPKVLPKYKNYNSNTKRNYNSNNNNEKLVLNISKTKRCLTNNHSFNKFIRDKVISPKDVNGGVSHKFKVNNNNSKIINKELMNVNKYISHNNSKSKYNNCLSVHDNKKIYFNLNDNNNNNTILPQTTNETQNTNGNNKGIHLSKKRSLTKNYSVSSIILQPIHKYSNHFNKHSTNHNNTNNSNTLNKRNNFPDTENTTASNSNVTINSNKKVPTLTRPRSTKHIRSKTPNKEQLRVSNDITNNGITILYKKENTILYEDNSIKSKDKEINFKYPPKHPNNKMKNKDEEIDPFKKILINPFRVIEDKTLKKVYKNNNHPNFKFNNTNNMMCSNINIDYKITHSLGNNISHDKMMSIISQQTKTITNEN